MGRAWYFISLVPLVIGAAIAGFTLFRLLDQIKAMPRLVVPGERTLALAAGEHVVYAESDSVVDGVVYNNERFSVKCTITAADGTPINLATYSGKMQYSMGDYAGGAMFTFEMSAAGSATLRCETNDAKAVLAVGGGIGASVLVAVFGALLGLGSAIVALFVVRKKRKRYLELVAARDNT